MLGNKEKDKIVKRYGDYYWEQIKKLSESYDKDLEERAREIEQKDKRIAELEQDLEFTTKTANELIEIKHKLEQELAELKEKAIDRPKFKHLEEYWYIENNPYCDNELQVFNGKVMEIICAYDEDWLYEYRFDTSCRYIEEDNIFATEKEAQAKLKEIQGNE